jgi:transcriptional regulator of met regulon
MACSSIGVSLDSARLTLTTDARFRRKCHEVPEALTENVRASLYSNAIKGTVAAQSLWFKEDAARRASGQDEVPMSVDDLLAELDRVSRMLKSLRADSK